MKRLRTTALALVFFCLAGGQALARDTAPPSRLVPNVDAPRSWLRAADATPGLAPATPASRLGQASTPSSALREAEVPAHLRARTRELTQLLQATQTPQQEISIDLPGDVLFDFDSDRLRPDAAPSLAQAAELLQGYPQAPLTVRGHTDGKGSDAYNDDLSLRRARAVAAALQERGARAAQRIEGMGKRQPVAPNTRPDGSDHPEGRQQNRRVQILIGLPPAG